MSLLTKACVKPIQAKEMAKILLVDDDVYLGKLLREWLEHEKHKVDLVLTGTEANEFLEAYKYDVIVLDWGLPDVSGIEVCNNYRKRGGTTPILILTGKGHIAEKEAGLDSGADDYLTKPFEVRELAARLRALLRRPVKMVESVLTFNSLELNARTRQVTKNGVHLKLPPAEFALLEFLMRNTNSVYSSKALLNHVWTAQAEVGPETVRTSISRLRQHIDEPGKPTMLENVHGVGYKLRNIDDLVNENES